MENAFTLKKCEICFKEATCVCFKCMSYFCDSCYNLVHQIEQRKTNKKDKIDLFIPIEVKCPEHNLVPMNLFCLDEQGKIEYNFIFHRTLLYILLL